VLRKAITAYTRRAGGWWPPPLARAHAHRHAEQSRALYEALEHGFTSVEADVWLVDGELRVGHDLCDTKPGASLRSSYLEPLARRVRRNGGSVYRQWSGSVQLLIDVKSDAASSYCAIESELAEHSSLLTNWTNGRERAGPVTAVVSGNRPLDHMLGQRTRLAGYDGRLTDLGSRLAPSLMPIVSDDWERHFHWRGLGPMPADERAKLRRVVAAARAAGYAIRFWNTPDQSTPARTAVWWEELAAGVDYLNTDDAPGLRDFLLTGDAGTRVA
jgi:hypothetical protein